MAGTKMAGQYFPEAGFFFTASRLYLRTPGMEATPDRDIYRIRSFSLEQLLIPS